MKQKDISELVVGDLVVRAVNWSDGLRDQTSVMTYTRKNNGLVNRERVSFPLLVMKLEKSIYDILEVTFLVESTYKVALFGQESTVTVI